MDVCQAVSAYVERMVKEVRGMKMLLLDDHTTPTMSATFTQSALLEHEVYLTDKLSHRPRERMHHLQCLVYVRPCPASIHALCQELLSPKYGAYWLYFSNVVAKHDIEALAEADQHQLVQAVQEFFSDYVPVTASHFTLQYDVPPHRLWGAHLVPRDPAAVAAASAAGGSSDDPLSCCPVAANSDTAAC